MTPEVLERKRAQFLALAERAFQQMFGSDGQNGLVTFAEREERACEGTDGLARWLMAEHVAQDRTGEGGVPLPCPLCQGPVPEASGGTEGEQGHVLTVNYSRFLRGSASRVLSKQGAFRGHPTKFQAIC